jgi:tetratricopeptide (TPR) repeat protein
MATDEVRDSMNPAGKSSEEELDEKLRLAGELSDAGRYDEAIQMLRELAEQYPESPLPHHNLSVIYLLRLQEDYEHLEVWEDLSDDEKVFEQAVSEAEAALALQESFVPALNNLGTLFALRGWWQDAINQWERSLSEEPGQPLVREDLAEARSYVE